MMAALAAQPQTAISARAAATNPGVPSSAGGTCSSSGIAIGGITPLRIASVFIVLASSTVGILLPFIPEIASRNTTLGKKTKIFYEELFFTLKHVGTGVIIATAFVHLSYEAMVDLESPCLNLSYKPLSPVLSMCSLGLIFLVDCWMTRYLHRLKKTNNARPSEEHTRAHGEDLVHTEHRHQLTHHGKTSKPEANHHKSHEKAQEKRHLRVFPISSSHRKLENTMQRGEDSIEDVNSRLADRSKEIEVYIIEGGIV